MAINKSVIYWSLLAFASTTNPVITWPSPALAEILPTLEITELMYDAPGNDTGQEWLELTNTGSVSLTVTTGSGAGSWRLADTTNHTFSVFRGSNLIAAGEAVIATADPARFMTTYPTYVGTILKIAISLPNRNTTLKLSADKGLTWFFERPYEALVASGDGHTLEWTGLLFVSSTVSGGSPGVYHPHPEAIVAPEQPSYELRPGLSPSLGTLSSPNTQLPLTPLATEPPHLEFTEINYNPVGSDSDNEWLEIENFGGRTVSIVTGSSSTSWRLEVNGMRHTLTKLEGATALAAGDRLVITTNLERFHQNYPTFFGSVAQANLGLPNTEGSLHLSLDGGTSWVASFIYRSSDGGNGDGRSLEQTPAGIWRTNPDNGGSPGTAMLQPSPSSSPTVLINEFLPVPGAPDGEWIELVNSTDAPIDLMGWRLDDRDDGGSETYQISTQRLGGSIIPSGGYLVFTKKETGLILTNTTDHVRLLRPDQSVADDVPYETPTKTMSWVRLPVGSGWTITPTPGAVNRLVRSEQTPDFGSQTGKAQSQPLLKDEGSVIIDQSNPRLVTLADLPREDGWHVSVTDTVARKTSSGFTLGKDSLALHIYLPEATPEIYRPRAHDLVTVIGILSWSGNEPILTVTDWESLKIQQPISLRPKKKVQLGSVVQPAVVPPASVTEIVVQRPEIKPLQPTRYSPLQTWTRSLPVAMMGSVILLLLVVCWGLGFRPERITVRELNV